MANRFDILERRNVLNKHKYLPYLYKYVNYLLFFL